MKNNVLKKWWSEELYHYYTLQSLTDEIIEIKKDRAVSKPLSDESYDFIVTLTQVI